MPYNNIKITCACGAEFDAGSTLSSIRVDICSQCHPFFTGEKRIVDSEGRVDKFNKRYNR
ncbi:50S ribosomal protein L31 [Thermoproteota archaeon]